MDKPKILIVDDDAGICTQMKWALIKEYTIFIAQDRGEALRLFKEERTPVVILDLGLPPKADGVEEGFLTLAELLEEDSFVKVIIITGREEKDNALRAVSQGGYDFFYKPIVIEDLKVVVRRALYLYNLEQEHVTLQKEMEVERFEGMLGNSAEMQEVFNAISKVATTNVPVLILGESGTGKELAARAIHKLSDRAKKPFVAINCGAIPENLLESELFGHEKGAFTGAHIQRKGKVEMSNMGTLFLDEIGELPMYLQVKLLRFLQESVIEHVGGRELITVDTRIISATNVDLKKAMEEGRFREDLFYRLSVVVIYMPPLRQRQCDLMLLANAFFQEFTHKNRKKLTGFSKPVIQAIQAHAWPGNVRELKNRIERAVIMAEGKKITPKDMELESPYSHYDGLSLKEAKECVEKELIQKAMIRNKGKISKVAEELNISRPSLYELIDRHGIERK